MAAPSKSMKRVRARSVRKAAAVVDTAAAAAAADIAAEAAVVAAAAAVVTAAAEADTAIAIAETAAVTSPLSSFSEEGVPQGAPSFFPPGNAFNHLSGGDPFGG